MNTKIVARLYDAWAGGYDRINGFSHYEAHLKVAQLAGALAPAGLSSILDLATGTGFVLSALKSSFEQAAMTGLDISPNMLDQCRSKNLADNLQLCDIEYETWPVGDRSIDLITCAGALSMIGRLSHLLAETHRTLKDDGLAVISFFIRSEFSKGMQMISGSESFKTYRRNVDEISREVQQAGFSIVAPPKEFIGFSGNCFREKHGVMAFVKA